MAKKISAATVSVDLIARSSSFSEVLDRAQRQSATSSSAIIRSLGKLESFSKTFENKMNGYLFAPFKAFKTAVAPFTIGTRQVINSVQNMLRPFKNLAVYVSGPFVSAFNKLKGAMTSLVSPMKWVAGGVAALVTGFAALVIGYSKAALETDKLSRMLGVSYKDLNQLSFVAGLAGVGVEGLADGLKDLSAKATDASFAGSGPLEPFFKSINKSKTAWDAFSPIQQLEKFADAMKGMSYNEVLYWSDEIGGSMAELAPLLAKGSGYIRQLRLESEMFGGAFNNVDGLREMQGVMERISFTAKNMFSGIGNALAPVLLNVFDTANAKFQEYLKKLSPDGKDAGLGFVKFANIAAGNILVGAGKLINGIETMADVIENAFTAVIDFINTKRGFFNEEKVLSGTETPEIKAARVELYQAKKAEQDAKSFNADMSAKYKTAETFKSNNQITKAANGGSYKDWASPEAKASYDAQIAALQEQRKQQSVLLVQAKLVQSLQEKVNGLIEEANAKGSITPIKDPSVQSTGDYLQELGNKTIAEGAQVESETKVTKPEDVKRQKNADSINGKFAESMKGVGVDIKSTENAIDTYKDLLKEKLNTAITIDEQINQVSVESNRERVTINAGAEWEINTLKNKLSSSATTTERDNVTAQIAELERKRDAAISIVERERVSKIKELQLQKQQELEIETKFQSTLRDLDVQFGFIKFDYRASQLQSERDQLADVYDERLAQMTQYNDAEVKAYEEMIERKKLALEGLSEKQKQAAIDNTNQQIADNESSLARTWSYLDEDYNAKVDAQVGITEMRESDIDEASTKAEDITRIATKTGLTETQVKAEQEAKQKANTLKLGSDLLAEGAKNNRKMFEANKMMNIANATIAMYTGATKAFEQWGYPYGAIASGLVIASGMMNIAQIKSQKFQGKAHKGQTTIDGTGDQSWILQGGERVVSKEQNVDLKNYLNEQRSSKGGSGDTIVYQTNHINQTGVTADDIVAALVNNKPALRKLLQSL